MKQPTFHGRVLLPLSVYEAARAGDIMQIAIIYLRKRCKFY